MKKLAAFLLDLLYPPKCCFCGKLSAEGICPACQKKLPYTQEQSCRQRFPYVKSCVSPLYYEGEVRASMLRYKFHGLSAYGETYGRLMAKAIDEIGFSCDIITWVPLSRQRKRKRGYDQAEILASELAAYCDLPCMPLLKKIRNNPAQSGSGNAAKRKANVSGCYSAVNEQLMQGKSVLLVDDVVTTGATLSECARVLRQAGCDAVYAAALARSKE